MIPGASRVTAFSSIIPAFSLSKLLTHNLPGLLSLFLCAKMFVLLFVGTSSWLVMKFQTHQRWRAALALLSCYIVLLRRKTFKWEGPAFSFRYLPAIEINSTINIWSMYSPMHVATTAGLNFIRPDNIRLFDLRFPPNNISAINEINGTFFPPLMTSCLRHFWRHYGSSRF